MEIDESKKEEKKGGAIVDVQTEEDQINGQVQVLSQENVRKRDEVAGSKRPKVSRTGLTFTEFTRLSER
jgi:hypothetical protein